MVKQDGLEWIHDTFGLEPRWTVEPKREIVESLARKHLTLDGDARCEVQFYAQGAFNKLYRVDTDNGAFLMRVSLPVDPHHKTMSEVATIKFVRQETEMPVPKIIAFDGSNDNDLGFEWILMELMPGQPLRKRWRKLPTRNKEELIKQLVHYQARLFQKKFEGIGNIYETSGEAVEPIKKLKTGSGPISAQKSTDINKLPFTLGRIVSLIFFWGDHLMYDVPRGPFRSSHDWLHTRLTFILTDQERILKDSDDEDDIEDAENARNIAKRLLDILPGIFPQSETESTVLYHDDLSMQNILVDETGKLTAVVDWECVSALPLWRACQIPALLEGRDRDEEPRREDYAVDEPGDKDEDELTPDVLDNEGVDSLYWDHLLEYEQTQLRRLFITEMERLQPGWVEELKLGILKADFEKAVHDSDNGFRFKIIQEWLDAYNNGESWSLRKRMLDIYYTEITWTYYVYWYIELYISIDISYTENSFSLTSSATTTTSATSVQATDNDAAQSSFLSLSYSLSSSAASVVAQMPTPTSGTYLVAGSSTVPYSPATATSISSGTFPTSTSTSKTLVGSGASDGMRMGEWMWTWVLGLGLAGLGL